MDPGLTVLAIGCVFGIVQIFVAAQIANRVTGITWSLSSRDDPMPAPTKLTGRLERAYRNYLETFLFAAAAILLVNVAGVTSKWTSIGAYMRLEARALYWILYVTGVPVVRSVAFAISIIGIFLILWPALKAAVPAL